MSENNKVVRELRALDDEAERERQRDPRHHATVRSCLTCGRQFESYWCGNRMCESCGGTVASKQLRGSRRGPRGDRRA